MQMEKKWNLTINAKINVGEVKTDVTIGPFCPTFDYVLENYFFCEQYISNSEKHKKKYIQTIGFTRALHNLKMKETKP